jgi:hypothetical protein
MTHTPQTDPLLLGLLEIGLGVELCPILRGLLPSELSPVWRLCFKAGAILCSHPQRAPTGRIYISNSVPQGMSREAEDSAFLSRVESVFSGSSNFLNRIPRARRMVDTDGHLARLYLDDLQELEAPPRGPNGAELLCISRIHPAGPTSQITRHSEDPTSILRPPWTQRLQECQDQGMRGLWGIRWSMGESPQVLSLLWINEARWSGCVEPSAQQEDDRADPRWLHCRELAAHHGLVAYPDAIELGRDGSKELTVGLCSLPTSSLPM